jgi:hypothetical protein
VLNARKLSLVTQASTPDDHRVLEELERLQHAIQAMRDTRERAQAEFAVHLDKFNPPTHPDHAEPLPVSRAEPPTSSATIVEPTAHVTRDATITEADAHSLFGDDAPSSPARRRVVIAAVAVIALIVISAVLARRPSRQADPVISAPRAVTSKPAVQPTPAPTAPAVPVSSRRLHVEITTLRRAWVRVVADGETRVERELKPDEHLPFEADDLIVVRAGDAGAVRVSVGGVDQGTLGADGQVITKRFAPAPK